MCLPNCDMRNNLKGTIKNGQFRDYGNILHNTGNEDKQRKKIKLRNYYGRHHDLINPYR
jgi:hypothetical protein